MSEQDEVVRKLLGNDPEEENFISKFPPHVQDIARQALRNRQEFVAVCAEGIGILVEMLQSTGVEVHKGHMLLLGAGMHFERTSQNLLPPLVSDLLFDSTMQALEEAYDLYIQSRREEGK